MIRKAKVTDVGEIQKLINYYAEQKEMLPRSLNELYENIQDFFVDEKNGKIIACAALHVVWEDLAEIKSLAVKLEYKKHGLGAKLVKKCLQQAKSLRVKKVFVLTFKPQYFKQFGFKELSREKLPHKIWSECIRCHLFPDCKEIALLINL
ncbi:MAG TPA: N-acetyltransferase [Elusimicrobia bacterium]|jgi:amino-acid N-acetyltransferase|nr:N-acetyltransferase [Elusimicrobiota bacterium]